MSQLLANAWTCFCDIQEWALTSICFILLKCWWGFNFLSSSWNWKWKYYKDWKCVWGEANADSYRPKKNSFSPYTLNQRGIFESVNTRQWHRFNCTFKSGKWVKLKSAINWLNQKPSVFHIWPFIKLDLFLKSWSWVWTVGNFNSCGCTLYI